MYLWLDGRQKYKRDVQMNTSQREQYGSTVHLFIGTERSLCKITSSTIAILLLLGVVAELFCVFGTVASVEGFKVSGIFVNSLISSPSALSAFVSTSLIESSFDILAGSSILCAGRAISFALTAKEAPCQIQVSRPVR